MKIYNYDATLLNFISEEEGTPDPLEPEKTLLPAFATFEPVIQCANGKVACFINNAWQCLANNLDVVYWNSEGKQETMLSYGDLPQGSSLTPPPPTAIENKNKASSLLYETDWTTIPDVSNSAISNPYLSNVNEFVVYRNQLRQIAVNPVEGNIDFPIAPTPQWITS
jgi:hypothetical protein